MYMPLVDKIIEKIICWIAKLLTYTSRVQLIKAVIFGLQIYWVQIFVLPKRIMKLIETTCRTFLWIGSVEVSNRALVSWEKVRQARAAGGLNVLNMYRWNKAAVMKQRLALATKKRMFMIEMGAHLLCEAGISRQLPWSQECYMGHLEKALNPRKSSSIWILGMMELQTDCKLW